MPRDFLAQMNDLAVLFLSFEQRGGDFSKVASPLGSGLPLRGDPGPTPLALFECFLTQERMTVDGKGGWKHNTDFYLNSTHS